MERRTEIEKVKEKNLTISQVKKLLDGIGEENLDQFQRRTLDYVSKFSKCDAESAEKLVEKLVGEFGLEEAEAVQIVNCMPGSIDELRIFLGGGRRIIETSKLESIVKLLNEHRLK
ncbi:MAG: RNA polymerase Rpb4 family protein [Candidatus Bathyarchaeota archaeon]|nr:RNA polymerase Rpb4 family protein [Candidatus Bathyarchaeota archaeon]MCX8176791.1 RNA polymerase Rpb4 family protein [Candidatus Bathyarchaeota archaeon]MDW8193320.1 RNA polymerase Rpb4 family protein [Nitrososphaerota archaeon]